MATQTIWGAAQHSFKFMPGVQFYGTASHGGIIISKGKAEQLPEWAKNTGHLDSLGRRQFEEDVAFCIPAIAFGLAKIMAESKEWNCEGKKTAEEFAAGFDKSLADWFPVQWEALHGRKLLPGESRSNDEKLFKEANKENWIVVYASQCNLPGFVKVGALKGGRQFNERHQQIDAPMREFYVPSDEYKTRSEFGFVVNLDNHQEIFA